MAAQHIVRSGLSLRVGNGQKIQIWSDKWLPTPLTFKVSSPNNFLEDHARVSELIDCENGVWKAELVKSVFLPYEAETILGITISAALPKDLVVWNAMSKGKFSVRSAYMVAMNLCDHPEIGSCSNDGPIKNFWRKIWSLQIPNKVKHFAWRACKNILPCLSNLKRKGIMVDDKCVLCGVEGESTGHLFWDCTEAAEVWKFTGFFQSQHTVQFQNFIDLLWFLWDTQQCSDDALSLAISIAWAMWTRRNQKRNGKKFMTNSLLVNLQSVNKLGSRLLMLCSKSMWMLQFSLLNVRVR